MDEIGGDSIKLEKYIVALISKDGILSNVYLLGLDKSKHCWHINKHFSWWIWLGKWYVVVCAKAFGKIEMAT